MANIPLAQTEERPYRKILDEDAESSCNPHCFFLILKGGNKSEMVCKTSLAGIFRYMQITKKVIGLKKRPKTQKWLALEKR